MATHSKSSSAPTPMMAQFLDIKNAHPGYLLFYRMGDFYELFFEDAKQAASALDITLTKRGQHEGKDIPMCGVPVHSADTYLARLIKANYKVAICEQMEDPAEAKKRGSKSVVKRGVVRLVTPGTLTEDNLLDARSANCLASLAYVQTDMTLAWLDISIGALSFMRTTPDRLAADLSRIAPSEVLSHTEDGQDAITQAGFHHTCRAARGLNSRSAHQIVLEAYGVQTLESFGAFDKADCLSLGLLIDYIRDTQKGALPPLSAPQRDSVSAHMLIDPATRRSLELTQTQSGERKGSLLSCIDQSVTNAGGRMLNAWISAPSCVLKTVHARQDMVRLFYDGSHLRQDIRKALRAAPDMERALTRLSLGRGGPRDLKAISTCLISAGDITQRLDEAMTSHIAVPDMMDRLIAAMRGHGDIADMLSESLVDEPPLLVRDGGFIKSGYDAALADHRSLRDEGRRHILQLEARYKTKANITSLKIKHNGVLGYHIDVPAKAADVLMAAPLNDIFIHRQTLANAVRFSTQELADLAGRISRAGAEAIDRELALFEDVRACVLARSSQLQACANALAMLDVFAALAEQADLHRYTRPQVDESLVFDIQAGRHPVVESALSADQGQFIANDCKIDDGQKLWLLTGPNMAGKSTFLRQNALIAILAQMGSFVPAERAHIGLIDKMFSRVGAADDLARGRSTFMVEMVETAAILNQAGPKSFVILDEIGRGTATYDGLSIAWATAEHLATVCAARAIFATHYHEMVALTQQYDDVAAFAMKVREWKGDLVFLHEVAPGAADRSYGVQVAKLAGMPNVVVERARDILSRLEDQARSGAAGPAAVAKGALTDLPLFTQAPATSEQANPLQEAMEAVEPDLLSPRAALELLYRLKALSAGDD